MSKDKATMTPAVRFLRERNIDYKVFSYDYQDKGGTAQTAAELKVDEHSVIKTLVLSADVEIFIILMHGDMEVSLKELARVLNCKTVVQCDAKSANKATGYQFGGTSPFGTRKTMMIVAEKTIFDLGTIYINGGSRGLILEIQPKVIEELFDVIKVNVGRSDSAIV